MTNAVISQKVYEALCTILEQRGKLMGARSAYLSDEAFISHARAHLNNAEYSIKEALRYLANEGL